MTEEELKAIRDRLDAASEGEWHYDSLDDGQGWTVFAPTQWEELAYDEDGREVVSVAECSSPQLSATQRMQNAELIAHAPTDLRALLAEVERLRGITPQFPHYPEGDEVVPETLPRYGIRWNGPREPLAVSMTDGYWTPWHLANIEIEETHLSYKKVLNDLSADVRTLTAERDNALAKAAAYEQDWYAAKSEFGAARSKMLQHIQEAFREGALKTRDAAATEISEYDIKVVDPLGRVFPVGSVPMQQLANAIRAIPLPVFNEDK
jgi:hypothetical protein